MRLSAHSKEQYPYRPLTSINIAHSGSYIYIDYLVRCNYLRAVNYENNSNVHQDSCVEFFVAPEGRAPYYNFEFNCIGTIHAACRMDRHNGTITMMANFYKCADLTSTPHFLSWAPIDTPEPDFHRPEFFAPITLEGK